MAGNRLRFSLYGTKRELASRVQIRYGATCRLGGWLRWIKEDALPSVSPSSVHFVCLRLHINDAEA